MEAYSIYNQITMLEPDMRKTTFMTKQGNYQYSLMPFGLKNTGATYQRMMTKVFKTKIGQTLEVYTGDMIVESGDEGSMTCTLHMYSKEPGSILWGSTQKNVPFGWKPTSFWAFPNEERNIGESK